jgi:hypothetical protein
MLIIKIVKNTRKYAGEIMNKEQLKLIIKEINKYWHSFANADCYICPHGGGQLDYNHCQSQVDRKGLIKHLKKAFKTNEVTTPHSPHE